MGIIASASTEQKKELIIAILAAITSFTKKELSSGISQCTMFSLDDLLRSVLKNDLHDRQAGSVKLIFISVLLGDEAVSDQEVKNLIITPPDDQDGVRLIALFMFSNREKVRQCFTKPGGLKPIFTTAPQ